MCTCTRMHGHTCTFCDRLISGGKVQEPRKGIDREERTKEDRDLEIKKDLHVEQEERD